MQPTHPPTGASQPGSLPTLGASLQMGKWGILTLVILTYMLVVAIPTMSLSVMSDEISQELGLSLVQVGAIWGIASLPAIFTSLAGGIVIDRLGPKKVLVICTLAAGLLGAGRGLAPNFYTLALAVFLLGALIPFVTTSGYKITGQWFPSSQLGLANGLISMGMALGFMLGSLLSATLLSPLLGGWRNVFILFGLVGALFALPWLLIRIPLPDQSGGASSSIRQSVIHIARLKNVWLLGLTFVGVGGCIQGILGYLPLHLIGAGWDTAAASGALAAFHTFSMLFVLPIALWSDRLESRKHLLMAASAMVALGAALMSFAGGAWVWAAVLMVGFVRDAFMAVFLTMVVETEEVGPAYAGTAVGLIFTIGSLGMLLAPPLGNGLAATWSGAPFLFWSGLAVFGVVCLSYYKSRGAQAPVLQAVESQAQL